MSDPTFTIAALDDLCDTDNFFAFGFDQTLVDDNEWKGRIFSEPDDKFFDEIAIQNYDDLLKSVDDMLATPLDMGFEESCSEATTVSNLMCDEVLEDEEVNYSDKNRFTVTTHKDGWKQLSFFSNQDAVSRKRSLDDNEPVDFFLPALEIHTKPKPKPMPTKIKKQKK